MLFVFVGVTFDLSWYYLNVSRMQNAADAAVIAGAQKLTKKNQILSGYNSAFLINGFSSYECYEVTRDISTGDKVAKTYVGKNLAKDGSTWDDDEIIDLWTRKNISFTSTLYSGNKDNLETLYYHVMLEEEVPHLLLNGWFPEMPVQVSSVARINYYLKGYDLFHQMKKLGDKQTYKDLAELGAEKDFEPETIAERGILPEISSDEEGNNPYVKTFNFASQDFIQQAFDDLIVTISDPNAPIELPNIGGSDTSNYRTRRIINVDKAYPIRDYNFYMWNPEALEKLRRENEDYENLPNWELAELFAKEPPDPLYIRIESAPNLQTIININVSNMDEDEYRPIVFFYEVPEDEKSLPLILNLNADFRGVLFAPNSPVVVNGNGYEFKGFIIAKSFVELDTEGEKFTPIEDEHGNTIYVDDKGEVQYKDNLLGQNYLKTSDFNIGKAQLDSFYLIKFEEETFTSGINLFTTEYAKEIK